MVDVRSHLAVSCAALNQCHMDQASATQHLKYPYRGSGEGDALVRFRPNRRRTALRNGAATTETWLCGWSVTDLPQDEIMCTHLAAIHVPD
ncbi:hypothetical protein AB0M54_37400 [Actinoplanes sp. NPDC051470]|uniref:hypothetical protein n=1 Tax=unclassified Actinoplanes TaxID=2626549 RepID=UPI003449ACAC